MEVSGGYDVEFVDNDIPEYLTCIVCQLALRQPILIIDCGHRLCQCCFNGMRDHATASNQELLCPYDRLKVDPTKVCEDKGISRVVLDLKVKCSKHTDGCNWTGELRDFQIHSSTNCTFAPKDTHMDALFKRLEQRITNCEKNLSSKEEELKHMKQQMSHKEASINLQLQKKDERINSLDMKVNWLQKEIDLQKSSSSRPSTVHLKSSTRLDPAADPVVGNLPNKNLAKQVKQLEKQVKVVSQLVSNKRVVYVWDIKDYHQKREEIDIGVKLYSPKFYSSVYNGHCCQLYIEWYGNKKGRLGVFFQLCRDGDGIINTSSQKPFDMTVEIRAVAENGEEEIADIDIADIAGSGEVYGMTGTAYFLNMPRLNIFIQGGNLEIICTLTPANYNDLGDNSEEDDDDYGYNF